jgi:FHA domain
MLKKSLASFRLALSGASGNPLSLNLGKIRLSLPSPDYMSFVLGPWSSIPTARVCALIQAAPAALATEVSEMEKFDERLAALLDQALSADEFVVQSSALESHAFTNDHGWRALFHALLALRPLPIPYARAAFKHYREYLKARATLARSLIQKPYPPSKVSTELAALNATGKQPPGVTYGFRQVRLPRNRTVELEVKPGTRLTISLADYPVQIWFDREWCFGLPDGQIFRAANGRCAIGRESACQLVVNSAVSSVSRRHIEIEGRSNTRIGIRDRSSMGSYVAPHSLLDRPEQDVTER